MGIVDGGPVPRIGSVVRLPNGRQGTVLRVHNLPILSWLFNTLYYTVQWNDGDGRVRIYPFNHLTVEGHTIGESIW
jgi:hypothetical protein